MQPSDSSRPIADLGHGWTPANPRGPSGTLFLEAGPSIGELIAKLDLALTGKIRRWHKIAVACRGEATSRLRQQLPDRLAQIEIIGIETWPQALRVDTPAIAYLPANAAIPGDYWEDLPEAGIVLRPWVPRCPMPESGQTYQVRPASGWIATTALLHEIFLEPPAHPNFFAISELLARRRVDVQILSSGKTTRDRNHAVPEARASRIDARSSVLAVVPYYNGAQWLEECVSSLVRQTRPPEAIVVVDDCSPALPLDIVTRFPNVTLLRTQENVGPFRIVQSVIELSRYDAYLFQDADDWSTHDRLQLLLAEAERSGAELIGTQEVNFDSSKGRATAVLYPLDANRSLRLKPEYALLHPTSLVSRDLVLRLGGFASGLRFGGDFEFQLRAQYAARIVNIEQFCYFRRKHSRSLTNSADTGLTSTKRQSQDSQVRARAIENAARVAAGVKPDLAPLLRARPIPLRHISGPALAWKPVGQG